MATSRPGRSRQTGTPQQAGTSDPSGSSSDLALPPGFFESETGQDPAQAFAAELGLTSPGDLTRGLSGITAAESQIAAARIQEALGREGLAEQDITQRRLEETLAPFVGFGEAGISNLEQLFQPTVAGSIAANPTITGLQGLGSEAVAANPFLAQLDPAAMEQQQLIGGIDLLSRERNDILNQIALGQASAAQQAAGGLQTGAVRSDLLSQIGNVQGAGVIGAQQSRAQGAQNITGLGLTLAGMFS
jgi:hypothetical protein